MQIHQLVLGGKPSLMDHKITAVTGINKTAMSRSRPSRMIFEAVRSCQYRNIIRCIFYILSVEIHKRSFGRTGISDTYIIGSHQRIVGCKQIIFAKLGLIHDFRCFQVIFPVIGPACYQVPMILRLHSHSCFGIQFHTVQTTEIRAIVHPPLSGFRILNHRRVYGIHRIPFSCLNHTPFLYPGTFGRIRLGHTDIGCIPAECRNTIIQTINTLIRHQIRSPDISRPFSLRLTMNPFHSRSRNLGKSPAHKIPMYQVF